MPAFAIRLMGACLCVATLCFVDLARSEGFPIRAVKAIVPFAPGTGADVVARALAAKLTDILGHTVVVENREGAGGIVGAKAVLAAPADGHTLLVAANAFVVSPLLSKQATYDPLRDFVPVARLALIPMVLVLHPETPAANARAWIALARARPGTVQYASSGIGTPSHLETASLAARHGLDLVHVPYKSGTQAITDVMGGQVSTFYPTLVAALPHIRTGRLRALGISAGKRSALAPEIPTMAEALDQPGYEALVWYGIVVRAGTPREVIAKLRAGIARAMLSPDLRDRVSAQGGDIAAGSGEDFERLMRAEQSKWSALIPKLGLEVK